MSTQSETIKSLLGDVKEISPYRLTQVAEIVAGRMVRPQMVYSYVRSGKIKASKNGLGKWVVKVEDGIEWIEKFVSTNSVPETTEV